MSKEESLAFEYGKTFDTALVPDGYAAACCFDVRMRKLVSEISTDRGKNRNQRNMKAWYKGLQSR